MHFIGNFSDIRLRLVAQHVANYCQASLVRITEKRVPMCGALWLEAIVVVNGHGHATTTSEHWEDQRWSVHQESMHDKLYKLALDIGHQLPHNKEPQC